MSTLGQTLKHAREVKKVTASQAAAATNLKMQHVEAMERDDFSRVAAPIYAKGFIRLYAEYLGLDPEPLIQEYMDLHAPKVRQPLVTDAATPPGEEKPPRESFLKAVNWSGITGVFTKLNKHVKTALVLGVAILSAVFIARCGFQEHGTSKVNSSPAAPPAKIRSALPVILNPPEPYMDDLLPPKKES